MKSPYPHLLSTADLADATGASFRQIDNWCRRGLITPIVKAEGSGTRRAWSERTVASVSRLVRFSDIVTHQSDSTYRLIAESQCSVVKIGNGITLHFEG